MIPKIIHYCWFSDPPNYPPDVIKCFDSWKKYLPDYEIKLWNTKNFDLSICPYAMEAYQEHKFAFASDYVRLWVLYNFGGIYLDSDIEVLRNIDALLDNKAFTGFENEDAVAAWIFGSEKGNPIFKEFLDDYKGRRFILGNGFYDMTPNPVPITNIMLKHGLKLNGKLQKLDLITIYPVDYFCPFYPYRKELYFTENTYVNHHFHDTWLKVSNEREELFRKDTIHYRKIFGKKLGYFLVSIKYGGLKAVPYLFDRYIRRFKQLLRKFRQPK